MRPDVAAIRTAVGAVEDPELPISLAQLGIIREIETDADGAVKIEASPTFSGCPALSVIAERLAEAAQAVAGVTRVDVTWSFRPDWDIDAISPEGHAALREYGIAVPGLDGAVACPYCGNKDVARESAFGPTLCRAMYHCDKCRNPFETMKRLTRGSTIDLISG